MQRLDTYSYCMQIHTFLIGCILVRKVIFCMYLVHVFILVQSNEKIKETFLSLFFLFYYITR